MNAALALVAALRDPASTAALDIGGWTAVLTAARAERLIGSLAHRLEDVSVPQAVAAILADARGAGEHQRRAALWEADCARRALADYPGKAILMKGTAYVAAGLEAGRGRSIGDLDLMVAEADLKTVEMALLEAGWEWVKEDDYTQEYYRRWMHELPPLIHRTRDRMIDVHHTILPKTARPTPDAAAMIDAAVPVEVEGRGGLYVFAPADMVCHSIAHLFADGELDGGLRNLWDIDRMLREFADAPNFWDSLAVRARRHQLLAHVRRALRLSAALYGTPVDARLAGEGNRRDAIYRRRLLARDRWGRQTRAILRQTFYIRGHLLRMPPAMLARHLWVKWRKG